MFDIRLGIINDTANRQTFSVQFYVDKEASDFRLHPSPATVSVAPNAAVVVKVTWTPGREVLGHRTLLAVAYDEQGARSVQSWDVTILDLTESRKVRSVWFEPEALIYRETGWGEYHIRELVRQTADLGIELIIFSYVEYYGCFHYPVQGLQVEPWYDYDEKKWMDPANLPERCYYDEHVDLLGIVLDEAERLGIKVLVGAGRSGDSLFFNDLYGWWQAYLNGVATFQGSTLFDYLEQLNTRLSIIYRVSTAVAVDVFVRYGHHTSFYGYYLSHEQNCMDLGTNYYDQAAASIRSSTRPNFPIVIAPYGDVMNCVSSTPVWETLIGMDIDIVVPQDSVGPGWDADTGAYTWNAWTTIPQIPDRFQAYDEEIARLGGKHLWAVMEVWRMRDSPERRRLGYGCWAQAPCEAGLFGDEVVHQIEGIAPRVSMITVNEAIGYIGFDIPGFRILQPAWRLTAERLYQEFKGAPSQQGP